MNVLLQVRHQHSHNCILSNARMHGTRLKGVLSIRLQEVEVQPRQLAVVMDRGHSTVQDLIDNTACMVCSLNRAVRESRA